VLRRPQTCIGWVRGLLATDAPTHSDRTRHSNERTEAATPGVTVGEEVPSLSGFNSQSQRAGFTVAAILPTRRSAPRPCECTRGPEHAVELPARSDASPSWARPPCSGRGAGRGHDRGVSSRRYECSTSRCESARGGAVDRGGAGRCCAGAVWGLPCRCRRLSRLLRRARCRPSVGSLAIAARASAAALIPTPQLSHGTADQVCGAWLRVTRVRSAS
jgi:hypothetical protein